MKCLSLRNNDIEAEGAERLARALQANNTLKALYLKGNQVNLRDNKFTDALTENRTLKILELDDSKIDDEGAERLATALTANNTLKTIGLRNNQISNRGAKSIADALVVNKSLEHIHLGKNTIKNEGSKSLANSLLKNGTLRWMSLDDNKIGDKGAQNLATYLLVNQSLRTLSLIGNIIGDEGAESLADALDSNHALETLDLEENLITNIVVADNIDAVLADPNRKNKTNKCLVRLVRKVPHEKERRDRVVDSRSRKSNETAENDVGEQRRQDRGPGGGPQELIADRGDLGPDRQTSRGQAAPHAEARRGGARRAARAGLKVSPRQTGEGRGGDRRGRSGGGVTIDDVIQCSLIHVSLVCDDNLMPVVHLDNGSS